MSLSNISTAISLLFPPTFVIFMHFYGFERVAFAYAVFMFLYLILSIIMKESLKNISTPLIYFAFVVIAYILSSMEFIRLIPALISASFFLFFLNGYLQKKQIILTMTKKFYNKLTQQKENYLAKSDGYWAFVILLNTIIQIGLVFYDNNELWAFYSSVGWYIFMFLALIAQIVYGSFYRTEPKEG